MFACWEDVATQCGCHGQGTRDVDEFTEFGFGSGQPGSAAGEQKRTFCSGKIGREAIESGMSEFAGRSHRRRPTGPGNGRDVADVEGRDVVGDGQDDGHPVGQRMLDGGHGRGGGIDPTDGVGAHTHCRGHRDLVDVPRPGTGCGLIPDDEDEGHSGLGRLGECGERIREPRAIGRGGRGDSPGGAEVGIGGDDGSGFVADGGVCRRGVTQQGVEEVGVAVAHEAEDLVDVGGKGVSDVRGGMSHGRPFANEIWKFDPYMSHTLTRPLRPWWALRFSRAPARRLRAPFSDTG